MRLYRAPFSTNAERVALALAHKRLEVESVEISHEDRSEVERVSGQRLVPVLVDDDGLVVSDSMQIVAHLERLRPDPPLYPAHPARRAETDVFVDWFDGVWKLAPNAILKYALRRAEADGELFHRVLEEYQQLGDDHRRLAAWIERVDARPRA